MAAEVVPMPLEDVVRRISTRERPSSKLYRKKFYYKENNSGSGHTSKITYEKKSRNPFSMRHSRSLRPMSVCSEPIFELGVHNKGNNISKQVMCNQT